MKAVIATLGAWLGLALGAGAAQAATFTVNSTLDAPDANPGVGGCATAAGACTLRAAIQEANHANNPAADTINFSSAFNGTHPASTIALASDLPPITSALTINGGDCDPGGAAKPCVGLDASGSSGPTGTALRVTASEVSIRGLAITGASFDAIAIGSGSGASVRGSWFGLRLDGGRSPVNTGVSVQASASNATVGGASASDRNVFTYVTSGVDVNSADATVVAGNYFGALPNGTLPPEPTMLSAWRVFGQSSNPADGNRFGGPDVSTPSVCDGECNLVIDGSNTVVLGTGQSGFVTNTQIAGNFLGLNLDGTTSEHEIINSILKTGDSDGTTIGGPTPAHGNVIVGAEGVQPAVVIESGSENAVVRHNRFGVSWNGAVPVPNNDESLRVLANGTQIRDNVFGSSGDPASDGELNLAADNAVVTGNRFGVGPGGQDITTNPPLGAPLLGVTGNSNQIGGTGAGDANIFGYAANHAIQLGVGGNDADFNVVQGNRIGTDPSGAAYPIGGSGIVVSAESNDNTIGGLTAASENVISNVSQARPREDAVSVIGSSPARTRLLRNRGTNNGDMFYDLTPPDGPGNTGANGNIQTPTVSTLTQTSVSGSGARPNAVIRAYRTLGTGGDVQELIGQATAGTSGNWSVTFTTPQANGACVTVQQTDTQGNSSELTLAQTIGGGDCDANPPNTVLSPIDQPTLVADSTPTFTFGTNPPEFPLEWACALDPPGGPLVVSPDCAHGVWKPPSPLADGTYTLSVAARDAVGNQDPTPARHTFTVDTTPPVVRIDSGPAPGSTTADATPEFAFSASDLTAVTFECRFDEEAFGPCAGAGSHTPAADLADGDHRFEVRATDALGHAATAHRGFTVDAIPDPSGGGNDGGPVTDDDPPETKITAGPPAKVKTRKRRARARFRFEADEPSASFECKLDRAPFTACRSPLTVRVKRGRHVLRVRAVDAAGNTDPTPARHVWRVKAKRRR